MQLLQQEVTNDEIKDVLFLFIKIKFLVQMAINWFDVAYFN